MLKQFIFHPILSVRFAYWSFLVWYAKRMRLANLSAYYDTHHVDMPRARAYLDRHTAWTERQQYWDIRKSDAESNLHLAEF